MKTTNAWTAVKAIAKKSWIFVKGIWRGLSNHKHGVPHLLASLVAGLASFQVWLLSDSWLWLAIATVWFIEVLWALTDAYLDSRN